MTSALEPARLGRIAAAWASVFALFAIVLGPLDDMTWSTGAGAWSALQLPLSACQR